MMDILPDVSKAKEFVDKGTSASNQFIGTMAQALLTAFNAGARTTSISTSGQAVNDIRFLLGALNQRGYKADLSVANTIQVRW